MKLNKMAEISIIIPSRNELYLQKTMEDILTKIKGDTEIIVGIDDNLTDIKELDERFKDESRIKVFTTIPSLIGQRAMQNRLAQISEAKYILKCDAHVTFSKGFDVELMKAMDDKTIMAPVMLPLNARTWQPSANLPISWFGFDTNLVTQIDKTRQTQNLIDESMTLHGSAWIITRENYWKWNICDETLGSWGYQAFELGYKAYLNGGQCKVNKNCYYAHLERQKEEDFPYERDKEAIRQTRDEVIKRYKNKSLTGLIEKFNFPFNWTKELVDNLPECN